MKILVINGDCVQTNTSANLCHLAYVRGLVALGHDVTLLSADGREYVKDANMQIPKEVEHYTYYGMSMYEKLSLRNKGSQSAAEKKPSTGAAQKKNLRGKLVRKIKDIVLASYGVHGVYAKFVKVAQRFRSDVKYDYVLSISTPVTSHLLAHNLLKAGHIMADHWIQIWEDPWYSDAYGFNGKKAIFREEKRLLSFAERVCYVSPLTLKNQQRIYPESASKMYWQPLPYYYKGEQADVPSNGATRFGYFGDYTPSARNLEPFYQAARNRGIEVNICGNPSNLFEATEQIHIHPRLSLEKLKPIEDSTNVLIFLCNKQGGQIPGKIYQYSATNKTILFILDGSEEEKRVLREYFEPFHRYIFCENTVEDISAAIERIEKGEFGTVRNEPVEAFNPRETIRKILEGK